MDHLQHSDTVVYTSEEVATHNTNESKWIIINTNVYDITNFSRRHPGGAKIISHAAGEDATDAWVAFHPNKDLVKKYMKSLQVGTLEKTEDPEAADLRKMRVMAEQMGLFNPSPLFFIAHMVQIILLYLAGWFVIYQYGMNWTPYISAILLFATGQAQAGWTQHDYGHLSVFKSNMMNHLAHHFTIGTLKGASSHWWNFRHFLHHHKTNVISKDPDVNAPFLFLMGEHMAKRWGELKKGYMPYQWQHKYFHIFGPPVLLPVYFHYDVIRFIVVRRAWRDALSVSSFFLWWFTVMNPVTGSGTQSFWLYMFVRFVESHWFTYVTQMSHIPMTIEKESHKSWLAQQVTTTANVEPGLFNDWFTGHLNYQIEHHLFPTMPRHNYAKIAPYVKALCKKYDFRYTCNPLLHQFSQILTALEKSGKVYVQSYYQRIGDP